MHESPDTLPAARIPRATYRLQFHAGFTFDDAVAILPYLQRLGVSHVYCSPIQRARPGSTHGYDVVAHGEINPELGGHEGYRRFSQALRAHGLGQLLDLVPNHMGVLGADNPWWTDVLENGPASAYAGYFDIDWEPMDADLRGKVLLPVLGDAYGRVLDAGELVLDFDADAGRLVVRYQSQRFPLAPATYAQVLARAEGIVPEPADAVRALRQRPVEPALERAVQAALAAWNRPGERDALHTLLEAQHYRLAFWRVASDEINYRRFFDINELAALRIERPEVFEATQGLALDLAARGWVDGLRIDHPDGLRDPAQYFARLQEGYARRTGRPPPGIDAEGRPGRPLYVVAEKIATGPEEVPGEWAIHGTTGYRFANVAGGVLVDTAAEAAFGRIWRTFTGEKRPFSEIAIEAKRSVIANPLASDMTMLAAMLLRIARADRRTRDFTLNNLRRALAGVAACMPVYRTYVTPERGASPQDRRLIDEAVDAARARSELADDSIFQFVRLALRGEAPAGGEMPQALREQVQRFAARFQQFSAPVAAKGVEDTAFYRWFPLAALNEVGGEPDRFGFTLEAFHAASADRARRWPHTMLATSTHDNKRSEDVRMRIAVLSQMPAAWRLALRRWRALNAPLRRRLAARHGGAQPSAADEYLLYQTLLGTWEEGGDAAAWAERMAAYLRKAAREAKRHTSWVQPREAYEAALEGFVRGALENGAFTADLVPLARRLAWYGGLNSLALMALKYTSPGVPDLYQGNELMDFSLVDPDNRRPVDYARRAAMLAAADEAGAPPVLSPATLPEAKLWIVSRLLRLRVEAPALLAGSHEALACAGPAADAVIAYARAAGDGSAVVVVMARFHARQAGGAAGEEGDARWDASAWQGTTLALAGPAPWRDVLGGQTHEAGPADVSVLLRRLPCAVLVASSPSPPGDM
ncbi:malto-oligosyltrehalose synthase [Xenophilus azovorans]|uniref:malto-oligosyltrehalose synthase n=1 Tax=Xenophilus azovorans TaxID=151755 RepID=UPI00068E0D48|nr:malto-oligosyltrehalose synthase [Xenophilus azovorans]